MEHNKYVVYTVMAGKYGEIHQPLTLDKRFDYILFSNDYTGNIGVWQVRSIPKVLLNDNKRLSRYPKSHPEELLSEYTSSLYIDANIIISDSWVYERCIKLTNKGIDIAGIKLVIADRDCIYRHAYDMCVVGVEHDYVALRHMHALYKMGYPQHFGLNENNIIFRTHNEKMKMVDEEWWWWIRNYSFRDQLSYMFCLWKYGINRVFFMPEGEDSHNSKHFKFVPHNTDKNIYNKKIIHMGPYERIRNRCRTFSPELNIKFCEQWVKLCKFPLPFLVLNVWGIYAVILIIIKYPAQVYSRFTKFLKQR